MFESVLDKGNKEEGLDQDILGHAFDGEPDIGLVPHLFDLDIIPDKFDLFIQQDLLLVAFIDQVAHDVRQLYHHLGRPFRFLETQGIDAVQCIEKEMRVQLRPQVPQLEKGIVLQDTGHQIFFIVGLPDKKGACREEHIQQRPQAFPDDRAKMKGKIGTGERFQGKIQDQRINGEYEQLYDQEATEGHQDKKSGSFPQKEHGHNDPRIQQVGGEQDQADQQQDQPRDGLWKKNGNEIDQGRCQNQCAPEDDLCLIGMSSYSVIVIFHGIKLPLPWKIGNYFDKIGNNFDQKAPSPAGTPLFIPRHVIVRKPLLGVLPVLQYLAAPVI